MQTGGQQHERALSDLRDILLRILPNMLTRLLSPGGGYFDAFLEDMIQETLLRALDLESQIFG